MTPEETETYELACNQLANLSRKIFDVERLIKDAIANEFSFNDCPRTVDILYEAIKRLRD